ncbi:hypothetical protein K490DRAFT_69310 [Saccharata proteae CBS 121410]|uniref:Uncharacterized protein n=1 Tax=Saccharata proteae CBS 121410 TaxID=1314787 RepID=A0A9P4HN91_9PEZI|nr:hypothetical protein K490DRAFT_69310 [Saccharata proteae CBS 121410]
MVMQVIRYTVEELFHLRGSPLVQKPDGLPSIEAWMESAPDQNQRKPKTQGIRNEDQAAGQENGGQRSTLFQTKHFTRSSATVADDIVLGPPKVNFASSRVPKLSDLEKTSTPVDDDVAANDRMNIRDKFFRERDKNGSANTRRGGREEGEGWNGRQRRSFGQEDSERPPRTGEHKSRFFRDGDEGVELEPAQRRNGTAKGRFDQPWGRENATTEGKDGDGRTRQGWRERTRDDREWNRRGPVEEDPEWMETPTKEATKKEIGMAKAQRRGPQWMDDDRKESPKAHTQEDFQRWKEQMKAGAAPVEERSTPVEQAAKEPVKAPKQPTAPLLLDGKDMFGIFGTDRSKPSDAPSATEGAPVPKAKPAKASRFAKLFSPQEEGSHTTPQMSTPEESSPAPSGNNEDKVGFERVLAMLAGSKINPQSSPQPSSAGGLGGMLAGLNLNAQPSQPSPQPQPQPQVASAGTPGPAPTRRSMFFPPPEAQSPDRDSVPIQPQPTRHHQLRSVEEKRGFIDSVLAPRGTPTEFRGPQGMFGPFPPNTDPAPEPRKPESRPDMTRLADERREQPSPIAGIQGLIVNRPPPQAGNLNPQSEFLLGLMGSKGQQPRSTPPQQMPQSAFAHPPPEMSHLGSLFPEGRDPRVKLSHQHPIPPGLYQEERQFPENDVRYDGPRRRPDNPTMDDALRRASRFNLPDVLGDPAIVGIPRRNTADMGPPRAQMTNMGIPQQPPPDQMWMKPPGLPNPQERPPVSMAPPPGFAQAPNAMRSPPGFGPNMGMPPFSAGGTPLHHPGMQVGRGPPGSGPAGMYQGQGPPNSYFPPPGMPPPPGFAPGPGGPGPMGMGMAGGPHEGFGMRGGPPPGMAGRPPNGFDMFDRPMGRGNGQGPFGL